MTPLHYACKMGYLPVVKLILALESGLELIDLRDTTQGLTPLMNVIYSQDDGAPEIVGMVEFVNLL